MRRYVKTVRLGVLESRRTLAIYVAAGASFAALSARGLTVPLYAHDLGADRFQVGALFSVIAVATMARIALVTAHGDQVPAIATALPWLPTVAWLAAALVLIGVPTLRRAADTSAPGRDGRG